MSYISPKPYPYLPVGKTIKYVPADNRFILAAEKVRNEQSTDHSVPTGAVIVKEGMVVSSGANKSALKNPALVAFHKKYCIRRMLGVPSGKMYWLCPGCASSRHHAESRAVKEAKSKRQATGGADLYLYGHWWCCKPCWDKMIAAGIKDVYLIEGATEKFSR